MNISNIFKKRNFYFFLKIKILLLAIKNKKITLRKIFNAFICNIFYIFKLSKSGKSPIIISVDLWNECNENCVFCRDKFGNIYDLNPVSQNKFIPKIKLNIEHFKNVTNFFHKDLMMIIPYVNGEPLMYKGIYEAIQHATAKKTLSLIATNGILLNNNNSNKLIESGLDFIKIHVSGMTNPVHQIQHRKGDVNLILKNIENLVLLKNKKKSNLLIMFDYILYKHNSHELELAKEFSKKNNLIFNIRPGNPKGMEDTELAQRESAFNNSKPCDWPWKAMTLNNNLDICPCCEFSVWSGPSPYGKVDIDTDYKNIWIGKKVREFRESHIKHGRSKIDICRKCDRQGIGFKF